MTRNFTVTIAKQLRQEILSGKYEQSNFLPSERQLCERYLAGRGVIRTALRMLRDEGLIALIPGRGAVVSDNELSQRVLKRFLVRCNHYAKSSSRENLEILGVLAGICMRAAEIQAEPIVAFSESPRLIDEVSEGFRAGIVQGLIFIEDCLSDQLAAALQTIGIPFLIANQENDRGRVNCRMNFRMIGRLAGRRLVEAGHTSIGIVIGNPELPIYHNMKAGFVGALAEDEIQVQQRHVFSFPVREHGKQLEMSSPESWQNLLKTLKSPDCPKAFFAMRDNRAGVLYRAATHCGLKIPQDLSVISYDDLSWDEGKFHGLSTIAQPIEEMGSVAVDMLWHWCRFGSPPPNRQLEGQLIERSSILPAKQAQGG